MLIRHLLSIALLPFVVVVPVPRMLAGERLFFQSARIGAWLLLFVGINHTCFLLLEEPRLAARFGERYERYRAAVPRWIPRRAGWP